MIVIFSVLSSPCQTSTDESAVEGTATATKAPGDSHMTPVSHRKRKISSSDSEIQDDTSAAKRQLAALLAETVIVQSKNLTNKNS